MNEEKLPELPKGWARVKLEDFSDINLGQSPPSSTYNKNREGLPFYQGKTEFGSVFPTPITWCSVPKKIAEKGDLLISVRAPVGPTNISPERSCIGRGLAAIRPLGGISSKFLLHLVRSYEKEIARLGTGTTFEAISGKQLKSIEFPLPPLPEQQRIVSKIEELFSDMDNGVESLKKAKTELRRYRQSVLKAAFEGKLSERWRKEHKDELEDASKILERIKEERKQKLGKRYRELPISEMLSLPKLPNLWALTSVGSIYDIVGGGTPSTENNSYWSGTIPWITSADIHGLKDIRPRKKINEDAINNSATNLVPKGSIIVVTRVGLGKVALTDQPICFSQDSQALVPVSSAIYTDYSLYYLSQAVQVFRYKHRGTTIPGVTKKQLSDILFILPPPLEQIQITEKIEQYLSAIEESEKTIEQSLKQAENLHQVILKRAFQGKLVPQDPSDEPATKLIEWIRMEKAKLEVGKRKGKRRKYGQ